MGRGYIQVQLMSADGALPVRNCLVLIKNANGQVIRQLVSDENGQTMTVELYAPDKEHTIYPNQPAPYYSVYDVEAVPAGSYRKALVQGVQIFDTITSVLPIMLQPAVMGDPPNENTNVYRIPPNIGLTEDFEDH